MARDEIDNEISVPMLCIRKNNNRAELDSIYREIKILYILKMVP